MPGDDAFCFERFKASDGLSIAGKIRDGPVTVWSIRHATLEPIGQAMKVQPVTADVYADNAAV
ncbi:hypothetical protein [Pseudooceanicola spongiae]|uniref:hypothetical protein n=1 Tax=Pseudooceanicola spongiae TaxID=2613965 RepID=UPI001D00E248|nr:hypothetical protein [Pseudooceanicola spongiae]